MEHQKAGVKDLYLSYIRGKTWLCNESLNQAHYWVESKRGTESSHFTCKCCGEIRKWSNSWGGHVSGIAKKIGKDKNYVDLALMSNTASEKVILPSPNLSIEKVRMGFKRIN